MALNVSIKNVPEAVVERLRERARRNHRSLQGELLAILEETISPRRLSPEEVFRRTLELGLKTGPESAAMVREARDGR
ncbi:MAG: Arc family DNA-binding protein [Elusimicrobia bacterium]|nr:Arc family DNA-binding protein [Elusimicrobiota bacterium]